MQFTKEQKKAIEIHGCDILVAAAAGSGKTAVLVERIIQLILNIEKPIDIDRLLVVTFTDAAASEMKQRIASAIAKKLDEDPINEHLQKQNALINKASITTIHSFCLSVIRQNFHLIDIDPSFRIANETEIDLIKKEVLDNLFEEEYSKEDNEEFFNLVECYGNKIKDSSLEELILNIYSFSENSPWPERYINDSVECFNLKNTNKIDDTKWADILKDEMKNILKGVLESIVLAENICKQPYGPEPYLDNLIQDRMIVNELIELANMSFEDIFNNMSNISFSTLKRIKKDSDIDELLQSRVKKIRNEIKNEIKAIKDKYFFKPPETMLQDLIDFYPVIKSLGDIVLKFGVLYKQVKKEKNIVDFNDLEHFCLEILVEKESTPDNLIRTKKAEELSKKYKEVLIDEYQDSNLVQEIILKSVSGKPENRFMVGDMKQSIYKFRRAKPELFIEKYDTFSEEEGKENLKIDLYKNFRSRDCVLSSVNFLFYQIMTKEAGEINYNESQALYTGAVFLENEYISKSTELHLIEESLIDESEDDFDEEIEKFSKIELEANIIAKRILEITSGENPLYVQDKEELRKAKFSDVVILVRSISSCGEIFSEQLKKYNIPVYVNTSDGFFNSIEVMTILAFLQIIDNPRQDIHLLTVLHSPVYCISNEELLEIRNINKKASFYDCVKNYSEQDTELYKKITWFLNDLDRWRDMSVYTPINELIWRIYDDTDYFNYVGVMKGGFIRQGNLRVLQEKAIEYESTSYKSLFHFIKYIERIQSINADDGNAKVLSENEDVVKIMTIHKSKGLEFPIVFVSMLGHGFNFTDERKNLILHSDLGFGPMYYDLENRIRSNTIARFAISKKIHNETISEELRVLYVALTRAKEKLILTGTVSKLDDSLKKYSNFVDYENKKLPAFYMLKANCFLDFIVPAIARHKDGIALRGEDISHENEEVYNFPTDFETFFWSRKDILEEKIIETERNKILYDKLKLIDSAKDYSGYKKIISEKLNWKYKFGNEKELPTKLNITEVKRNFEEFQGEESDINTEIIFNQPDFLNKEQKITTLRKGTIIHTFVEHMDLSYHNSVESIKLLSEKLIKKNIVTEEDVKAISLNKLNKFANSKLAERIKNSHFVKKESPFVLGLSPYEVYMYEDLKDIKEKILIHGIIDCYFEEDNNFILVDYKTDYVTKENINSVVEKYKFQLQIYKKALERSTGKKVSESIIYFFGIDDYIKI